MATGWAWKLWYNAADMNIVVGITGASGLTLADSFLQLIREQARDHFGRVFVVVSSNARQVAEAEGAAFDPSEYAEFATICDPADFSAPFASGSYPFAGMVVVPASMSTIGALASGFGTNLIHRCGDVCLKEGRKLVLVPRETPFSLIHLENMTRLKRAGADIVPFIPSFYNHPESVHDMQRFFSLRLLDMVGVHLDSDRRWGQP